MLNLAIEQHKLGNIDGAQALYIQILQAEPGNTRSLCLLALIKKDKGDHLSAINLLNQALKHDPSNIHILMELGLSYKALNEYTKAKSCYSEILKIDQANTEAICNLANVLMLELSFNEAKAYYKKALLLSPNNKKILFNLGTLFLKQLQPERSISYFKKALAIDPNYVVAINSLGVALLDNGNREMAKKYFRSAISHNPDFTEALFNLHAMLVDESSFTEAVSLLSHASSIEPKNNIFKFFIQLITEYVAQKNIAIQKSTTKQSTLKGHSADLESWAFIKNSGAYPTLLGTDKSMIEFAASQASIVGLTMEFGVFNGKSIRHIASLTDDQVHGFDSFEGIPEPWHNEPAGSYSALGKLPRVPNNVRLYKGWFDKTIPLFLKTHPENIRFINIDCDLYSSTKIIFDLLGDRIASGSIILFDEFIGYSTWKEDEFKAFHEAVEHYGWEYKIICFSFVTKQVGIKITGISSFARSE